MPKISRNHLKTIFTPGRKLRLTQTLLGPTDEQRIVHEQKSYGYVMLRPDGRYSHLRFEHGEYAHLLDKTITIHAANGEVSAKYVLEDQ